MGQAYVILDIKTSGWQPGKDEILELAAVRMEDGKIIKTWQSLVRPERSFFSSVSGLSGEDVAHAPSLSAILPTLLRILDGTVLVGYSLAFALEFLQMALEENGYLPWQGIALDILELAQILWPQEPSYAFEALCRRRGIDLEQPHRALSRAMATAELFQQLCQRGKELPLLILQQICSLMDGTAWPLRELFLQWREEASRWRPSVLPEGCEVIDRLLHRVVQVPADDKEEQEETPSPFDVEEAVQVLAQDGPLAQHFEHYEERPAQLKMARMVAQAFADKKHALIEAGTGTGKSLAYLVPSVYYATATGQRVVVATHTINLQEQLKERDIPLLQQILDRAFRVAVFKGRNNYLCMRKAAAECNDSGFLQGVEEKRFLLRLLVWLMETEAGDREELTLSPGEAERWKRVMSEADSCMNKQCPWFHHCYYHKAKALAQRADVVITNHSLIFADIQADHHVLPGYTHLVIDEAHHLEDVATRHLGEEASYFRLTGALHRLVQGERGLLVQCRQWALSQEEESPARRIILPLEQMGAAIQALHRYAEETFRQLHRFALRHATQQEGGRAILRLRSKLREENGWEEILSAFSNLETEVISLREGFTRLEAAAEDWLEEEIGGRLSDIAGQVKEVDRQWMMMSKFFKGTAEDENTVLWMEVEPSGKRPAVYLYSAPIDVGPLLHEFLYNKKEAVILTSATLTVDRHFQYAIERLGLQNSEKDGCLLTLSLESPFDYKRQALLCIPSDVLPLREVTEDVFVGGLSDSLVTLARISQGRMLVLFTSHRMLRETYARTKEKLGQYGIQLLAHGIDSSSRHRLVEEFQRHPQAVLFGAHSFWEGVDIPGDDLSCLVIVRLPFWPPNHPVVEARTEALEAAGKNAFLRYSVPQAVVRFKQGFGRLIRSRRDVGAIVVYDRRIVDTRYGRYFLRSLPGPWIYQGPERETLKIIYNWLRKKQDPSLSLP